MNNSEKYTGKVVDIYAPTGRKIDRLKVDEVLNDDVLCGESLIHDFYTAYYLSDGVSVQIN